MVFVSITRLHLRSWRYFLPFVIGAQRAARQGRRADGNLGVALHRDAKGGYWTCTLWRDESAMRSFMMSGVHARLMPRLIEWCDEACVGHFMQDSADIPAWPVVSRKMKQQGRKSRLRHPSPAHEKLEIPDFS